MIDSLLCGLYRRAFAAGGGEAGGGAVGMRARRHVRACDKCQALLTETDLLVEALGEIEQPSPPSQRVWQRIEDELDREGQAAAALPRREARIVAAARLFFNEVPTWAVAVVAVIAVAGAWQAREMAVSRSAASRSGEVVERAPFSRGRLPITLVPLSLDVGSYVQEVAYSSQPEEFWSAYRARQPGADNPYGGLDFEPLIPQELPHGFRLSDTKLLRDACCETVQARYESADRWLDLFEVHDDHPIEFGEASVARRDVSGVVCTAFEWSDQRIRGRSFRRGDLSLVFLGNVDDKVLDDLVAELGKDE